MTIYRRAWTMKLREGAEADYDAAHASVWPEIRAQMAEIGIIRYFLFRSGTTVFAYQERDAPFPARETQPSAVTARWWREMAPLMETGEANRPVHNILREIFAYDTTMETET